MTDKAKVAPHSKESEMMVLGCMLNSKEYLKYASEELYDLDFYFTEHQTIFNTLKRFYNQNKPVDVHLVGEELRKHDQLKSIGNIDYIVTLTQYSGTSANIEEYIAILKDKSLLRNLVSQSQNIQKTALENPEDGSLLIEKFQISLKSIEQRFGKKLPVIGIEEHLDQLDKLRNKHMGKKYLGLCVQTIEEFNEKLLGLRKLILLAAAPNVGKTALTIQLALEVLLKEKDACLAYFSLEMSSIEIFTRMNLYFSKMNFHHFIFGSQTHKDLQTGLYTEEEFNSIKESFDVFKKIGNRLQIIDTTFCPTIDSRTVINYIENLKSKTQCKRAIVIIDYLQVWPANQNLRFLSEIEMDKWRIGEMKKIRDAMGDDPIIVISEARKPSGINDVWGGELSDVMGSARSTYTPDVVMLLSQLKPKALAKVWEKNKMPTITTEEDVECVEEEKPGFAIKNFLAKYGIAICKLEVPKARDGMQKFNLMLEYHFQKNIFKKIDWETLKKILPKTQKFF